MMVASCNCREKEKKEKQEQDTRRKKHSRVVEYYRWCDIGERLQECWLDNFDVNSGNKKMFDFAQRYISHFQDFAQKGLGAVFEGPVGVGKTHLAVAIFKEIVMQDRTAIFIRFTDLVTRMQEARSFTAEDSVSDLVQYFNNAEFCVLDDVGSLKASDIVRDFLYKVIDGRYQHKKPTMITTNYNDEQMKAAFGDAIFDRIAGSNIIVPASGASARPLMRDKDIDKIMHAGAAIEDEKRKEFEQFLSLG